MSIDHLYSLVFVKTDFLGLQEDLGEEVLVV